MGVGVDIVLTSNDPELLTSNDPELRPQPGLAMPTSEALSLARSDSSQARRRAQRGISMVFFTVAATGIVICNADCYRNFFFGCQRGIHPPDGFNMDDRNSQTVFVSLRFALQT